ncbi:MAG: DUF3793 family protein [Candidatus Dadabacteria bacterium]|nr:MAG: DUF3793 family protein [Candidatus Dadabacteria bacterium]
MNVLNAISRRFHNWKKEIESLPGSEPEFQKWLFIHIAGVLFGGKAGELLTLTHDQCGLGFEKQLDVIERLSAKWEYSYLLLHQGADTAKVIFYTPAEVRKALSEIPPCILIGDLKYEAGIEPEEFLNEIKLRWKENGKIPHEVGVALGYPVKDVLGYMGLLPLECNGICGWRIYGNPDSSLNKCRMYVEAKQEALIFLAA